MKANEHIDQTRKILCEDGVIELSASILRKTKRQYNYLKNEWVRYLHYRFRWGESTPHPKKIIQVNPHDIQYAIAPKYSWASLSDDIKCLKQKRDYLPEELANRRREYNIINGEWDNFKSQLSSNYHVSGVYERYAQNRDWRQTEEFLWHKKIGRNEEKIMEHFNHVDQLYNNIKNNGYNSRYPIWVHIGRNGEIIRDKGFHRIAISQILDIEQIPAIVKLRHDDWQMFRNKIHSKDSLIEIDDLVNNSGHPDLNDVID